MDEKVDNESKSKIGRPSDYDPKYCKDIIEHMKRGGSIESFGAFLAEKYGDDFAASKSTVYRWLANNEEFRDAKDIGQVHSLKFFEDIGNRGMLGQLRTISSEVITGTGKNKKVDRKYRTAFFQERVWSMNMKNRFGWQDRKAVDHSSTDGSISTVVNLNIPVNGREKK